MCVGLEKPCVDVLLESFDDAIDLVRNRKLLSFLSPRYTEAGFLLNVGIDVNHKIIVVLKGAVVILSLQTLEHVSPTSGRFRQGSRGLNGRLLLLVLEIPEKDVLNYRLVGRTFGDNSEL
jgi:hypothetical protein